MRHPINSIILLTAITLGCISPALATEVPSFPVLIVTGEAREEVRPDKATLSLWVTAFHPQSAIAATTAQRQLAALLDVLATHSVPESAITSFNLSKQVERKRTDRVDAEIVGYYISRQVRIELQDISGFAELVADIARLDNISSLDASFDVKDRKEHEQRLMNAAGADARQTAEIMLQGMSRKLDAVHAISESSFRSDLGLFKMASNRRYPVMADMPAQYADTIFEPSTIELRQTIQVMFRLK